MEKSHSIPGIRAESAGEKTVDQTVEISSCSVRSWSGSTGVPVDLAGGEKRGVALLAVAVMLTSSTSPSPRFPSMATPIVSTGALFFKAIPWVGAAHTDDNRC